MAKHAALARIAPLGLADYEAKLRGDWIDGAAYGRLQDYVYAHGLVGRACGLKTHKGRLAALAKIGAGK